MPRTTLGGAGKAFTRGNWISPTLNYSNGSVSTDRLTYDALSWSGIEPDSDASILMHILKDSDNSFLIGSFPLGSSPLQLSGLSAVGSQAVKVQFDTRWVLGKPQIFDWELEFVPIPLGDRSDGFVVVRSGAE